MKNSRSAFTLLELLIVISIISMMIALISPALMSVTRRAKEGAAFGEIMGLSNACDSFKAKHGVYPPSSITLYERWQDWSLPAARPHKALIRRIFGTEFDFENRDPATNVPRNRDINGNGIDTETLVLSGSECLVFFLGGMPEKNGALFEVTGFSSNRRDPFSRVGSSRDKFFARFDNGRLIDTNGNGMPEYVSQYQSDQTTSPMLYFSLTRTSRYEPTDCPGTLTSVYMRSPSIAWMPDSFQIVTPGYGGEYGVGGEYASDAANVQLAFDPDPAKNREPERDNITNFSGGRLAD